MAFCCDAQEVFINPRRDPGDLFKENSAFATTAVAGPALVTDSTETRSGAVGRKLDAAMASSVFTS